MKNSNSIINDVSRDVWGDGKGMYELLINLKSKIYTGLGATILIKLRK